MRTFVFDDQPLDALLYGTPDDTVPPPTQASLYPDTAPWLEILRANLESGDIKAWRENLLALSRQGVVLPPSDSLDCMRRLSEGWGDQPCPKLGGLDFPNDAILQPMFDRNIKDGPEQIALETGDALVRWYEAGHRHHEAAAVLAAQLDRARHDGDALEQARCSNNLGYELTLAGEYEAAQPHLERAVEGFTQQGAPDRANNARTNLLTARFHHLGLPEAVRLEAEIREVSAFYAGYLDPRERKPLNLLARLEESCGDLAGAIACMDKAVALGQSMDSWLVDEDRAYLTRLKEQADLSPGVCSGQQQRFI